MDLNMDTYCENYQEALNFSGFLPMGLMCPCHEKLPTTFTSQPLKSLWHLGAWPQCGSWSRRARSWCMATMWQLEQESQGAHATTNFLQLGSKSNAVLDGQAFAFYGNLFISWHK